MTYRWADAPNREANREDYLVLIGSLSGEVHRFVASRVVNHADAEDIAQQTMLTACAKIGTYQGGDLRAWLFTIARHLVTDHYRAQNRHRFSQAGCATLLESENEPAMHTAPEAVQMMCDCRARLGSWVECLTARLPLEEQVSVLLADVHGYHDKESAALLSMSLPSYKLLLHGARVRLNEIAGSHCPLVNHSRVSADQPILSPKNGNGKSATRQAWKDRTDCGTRQNCAVRDDHDSSRNGNGALNKGTRLADHSASVPECRHDSLPAGASCACGRSGAGCPSVKCCDAVDCRLGIKCRRRVPWLLAMRAELLKALGLEFAASLVV